MNWIRPEPGGCVLSIKAQPRAARTEVAGVHGAELKVRIAAPPVDNAANGELLGFLVSKIGCRKGQVSLVSGAHANHKVVRVSGVEAASVAAALGMGLPGEG